MKYVLIAILAVVGADASARGNANQCKNGEQLLFPVYSGSESAGFELRTCKNGRWFEPSKPVVIGDICRDGETWLVPSQNVESGGYEFATCKNGRLYPPVNAPRVRGCTEGESLLGPDPRGNAAEGQQLVELICRRGAFVPRY